MSDYNPQNWYWSVAGATDRVFSSASASYVPVSDATYVAFTEAGGRTTGIDSEANLNDVLMPYGISTTGRFRLASGYALLSALTDDQAKLVKSRDIARLSGRSPDLIPEPSPFVARIASVSEITVKAWFDLALGVTA